MYDGSKQAVFMTSGHSAAFFQDRFSTVNHNIYTQHTPVSQTQTND